jgi:hypothetical protein
MFFKTIDFFSKYLNSLLFISDKKLNKKTRHWEETKKALIKKVTATKEMRISIGDIVIT